MLCLVTVLLFISLGFSRGDKSDVAMLLAYKDELEDFHLTSNFLSDDISNDIFFYLFTREGPTNGEEIVLDNAGSLESSYYNPDNLTKIIIHGFRDSSRNPMARSMKDQLLQQHEINVILVDWSKIARGIDYIRIAEKTVDVGACVALFIEFLTEHGAELEDFHLIGHSLGAHVAGFAGAAISNGTVGRITGLDPAMPGFKKAPPEKRLDRSDAKFVDCIHTCAGTLGLTEAICTADFYPNGGRNMQPGCPFYDFGRCSHKRAHRYFTESIDPNYKFPAFLCDSVPDDAKYPSSCTPSHVTMGYYTNPDIFGIYFVSTNEKEPFAPIHP